MSAPGDSSPSPAWLVTADEMRAIEARAAKRGETGPVLMERAARRVAAVVAEQVPRPAGRPALVLVLVGPGNNGGDGLWAARFLHERGLAVACYLWHRPPAAPDPPAVAAQEVGIPLWRASDDADRGRLAQLLRQADAVIDALLGFGLGRDIAGDLAELIGTVVAAVRDRAAEGRPLPVFAVDIPTGVDSDTGAVRGVALPAAVTITLGVAKRGLYLDPGAAYTGAIILGDIGVRDLTDNVKVAQTTADQVRGLLPARPADSNKGTFGSVLIVAGSLNYIGAGVLAVEGAMRVGVGLATLATPIDLLPIVAAKVTECTFLPLPSEMGVLTGRAVDPLFEALGERSYKAMLIGNGFGREKETLSFVRDLLQDRASTVATRSERHVGFAVAAGRAAAPGTPARPAERRVGFGVPRRAAEPEAEKPKEAAPEAKDGEKEVHLPPLVVDADGLNLLAQIEDWATRLPADSILTPHPGEMARLLGGDYDVDKVQADRVGIAQRAAADWKQIVVLKGAHTVIAAPDGRVQVNPIATAALATAGTGDVLAGIIAGLRAQGLAPFEAAVAGVFIHGQAGERLAHDLGDTGVLAGDLAPVLPHVIRALKEQAG